MKTTNVPTLKINKLTQAQYDRELANGNIDENALYMTPDESLNYYVFTGVYVKSGEEYTVTLSNDFRYAALRNAIENNYYVSCILTTSEGTGRIHLTPSYTLQKPSSAIRFSGLNVANAYMYRLIIMADPNDESSYGCGLERVKFPTSNDAEEWTFTLEDGSTVTKAVYVG